MLGMQLEQKVNEVEQFYLSKDNTQLNSSKGSSIAKEKVKEKLASSTDKQQQDAPCKEVAASKRMQELMRQFATIFRQASTLLYFLLLVILSIVNYFLLQNRLCYLTLG